MNAVAQAFRSLLIPLDRSNGRILDTSTSNRTNRPALDTKYLLIENTPKNPVFVGTRYEQEALYTRGVAMGYPGQMIRSAEVSHQDPNFRHSA